MPHEISREAIISGAEEKPAKVWDVWTRLFHWSLVVLVFFAWGTAEYGHMDWHQWCGDAIFALLIYRLYWGLVGASTARFSSFVKGPGAVVAYLRELGSGAAHKGIGHNPLGALSIVAMLVLLVALVVLGLFAVDVDGVESGPLATYVSFDQGRFAAHWHHLLFNAMLALIALHLLAIAYYALVKRDNLVGPMITGRKAIDVSEAKLAPLWRAIPGALIAGAVVFVVMKGFKF